MDALDPMSPEDRAAFADRIGDLIASNPVTEDEAARKYLAILVMEAIAAEAEAGYTAWSTYALGRVGETRPFYIGMSTRPQARLHQHMATAKSALARSEHPLARAVFGAMEPNGPGVWLQIIAEGLNTEEARDAEASMIRQLLASGVPLLNQVTYAMETPAETSRRRMQDPAYREFNARLSRERHRERYGSDPTFRNRRLAKDALYYLRKGRPLTARRQEHITAAGRVEEARAVLEARGERWPE